MPQTTQEITKFYLRQTRDSTAGMLEKIAEANGFALHPQSAGELRPVPVYEEDAAKSLLTVANNFRPTTIKWPAIGDFEYLQAYFKRYRDPQTRRVRNEVVINASNYCWARFYAAKELMHCLTDDDGYPASNTIELVNDLIADLAAGGMGSLAELRPQTIVDEVAWIGACEYLVPTAWLPMLGKLHQQLEDRFPQENAYLHIAQIIRAPELILRQRLKWR